MPRLAAREHRITKLEGFMLVSILKLAWSTLADESVSQMIGLDPSERFKCSAEGLTGGHKQ